MFTKETVRDSPIESRDSKELKNKSNHFEGFTYIEKDVPVSVQKTDQFLDIN